MDIPIDINGYVIDQGIVIEDSRKISRSVKCYSPLIPGTDIPSSYLSCIIVRSDGSIKYYVTEKKSD